jgi:exopolyphosphatase/guanosine-5'-triphosphate,3'-diphosphate pyrophosphatase
MRLGVLDIGSNSAHLQVVDAHPGSPPLPVFRHRVPTRLAEVTDAAGGIDETGTRRLVTAVREVVETARSQHVAELIPFATAAVRDAANRDEVVGVIAAETGVTVGFLSGEDEGRLTYFAAHRWYGWSAGPLLLLDIGGGSVEIAYGRDEDPSVVVSLPLGAGRLTRTCLPEHPASPTQVKAVRQQARDVLQPLAQRLSWEAGATHVVATSKTFKQLARLVGCTTGTGRQARRVLRRQDLKGLPCRLAAMTPDQRAKLPGVATGRARQILAGAIIAEALLDTLRVRQAVICPWALREGVLLRRLSPLLSPDSLHQIQLIQAAADPDTAVLDHRRALARGAV